MDLQYLKWILERFIELFPIKVHIIDRYFIYPVIRKDQVHQATIPDESFIQTIRKDI
jgi:hypothetical protein